ncbi:hypothetical protein HYX06_01325 [Candidatus Woesearchaeota archaeon]|nr:hypothetical protein [Candidatus Woesearchaeota archaeon]
MTKQNLMNRLVIDREQAIRDLNLMVAYFLTESDIDAIRSQETINERIIKGARTLVERLGSANVDPIYISAQITEENLALLVDDGSYETSPPVRAVYKALSRKYHDRRELSRLFFGLDIPLTQFLREDLGAYQGNLKLAKIMWPDLEVSQYDWAKSIRIPIRIGFEEGKLLGIFYGKGKIMPIGDDRKRESDVNIGCRDFDVDFHEQVLLPLIRKVHNIILTTAHCSQYVRGGENYYLTENLPNFEIYSLALVSWLQHSIGMEVQKEQRTVPSLLETHEQKLGFLVGVLASRGRIYSYPDKTMLRVGNMSGNFLDGLRTLSQKKGLNPFLTSHGHTLEYTKSDIMTMMQAGMLINPHHVRQYNYNNPPARSGRHSRGF